MINSIRLLNFKGHSDTEVSLARLTMLVGDNASGKSSVLEALALQSSLNPLPYAALKEDNACFDLIRRNSNGGMMISTAGFNGAKSIKWTINTTFGRLNGDHPPNTWQAILEGSSNENRFNKAQTFYYDNLRQTHAISPNRHNANLNLHPWDEIGDTLGSSALYDLKAREIAASTFLAGQTDDRIDQRGTNTAAVLVNIKLENYEVFSRIEESLRRLVPTVRHIRLIPVQSRNGTGHRIFFDFEGSSRVPAHCASQGTLIALSLLTIIHDVNRPNLILLDDFDHALHPRAQIELIKMIRALLALEEFANLQIVATSHSPYSLDGMDPSDVQVFALRPEGTVTSKRLSQHPDAMKTRGALTAGELWSLDAERDWVLEK